MLGRPTTTAPKISRLARQDNELASLEINLAVVASLLGS